MEVIFLLAILIFSIVIHEVAHGSAAEAQGDPTAKYAGRLTLNPIKHLDFVGSFLVPLLCVIFPTRLIFGWAKPVPINPYNFKDQKYGSLKVAVAGPGANFLVAAFFGVAGRMLPLDPASRSFAFNSFFKFLTEIKIPEGLGETGFWGMVLFLFLIIIFINILLAIFNLIPIPPLDGSHILSAIVPGTERKFKELQMKMGILILPLVFLVIYLFLPVIFGIVIRVFILIAGA